MNTLTRWNPVRELEEFQNRILNAFRPGRRDGGGQDGTAGADWFPPVNVEEDETGYHITAELPGVRREDVRITLENNNLSITGQRPAETAGKDRRQHLIERTSGSFFRSFLLPGDGDAGKVDAQMKDGILRIHVPKSEAAKPRQIEVKAA